MVKKSFGNPTILGNIPTKIIFRKLTYKALQNSKFIKAVRLMVIRRVRRWLKEWYNATGPKA